MKSQISLWAVCLLAAALFLLPQAAQAQCSLATFTGPYVFNNAGVAYFIAPVIATTSVGTLTANGAGSFTFSETAYELVLPAFGNLLPLPLAPNAFTKLLAESTYSGTYQVNPDCTMAMTWNSSNNNCFVGNCYFPIHVQAVLVRGGKSFYLIDTDPGRDILGSGAGTHL